MEKIGDYLRHLRGKMTLREVSEKSGLSHSYIRYLEKGKRPGTNTPINPTPETLKALSLAYNYPYDDLMKRAGYLQQSPIDEDLEGYLILQEMKYKINNSNHEEKEQIKEELKEWSDLLELDTFLKEIELSDVQLLDKYNFKYKGRKLDDEKTKKILSFIRFVAQEENE